MEPFATANTNPKSERRSRPRKNENAKVEHDRSWRRFPSFRRCRNSAGSISRQFNAGKIWGAAIHPSPPESCRERVCESQDSDRQRFSRYCRRRKMKAETSLGCSSWKNGDAIIHILLGNSRRQFPTHRIGQVHFGIILTGKLDERKTEVSESLGAFLIP